MNNPYACQGTRKSSRAFELFAKSWTLWPSCYITMHQKYSDDILFVQNRKILLENLYKLRDLLRNVRKNKHFMTVFILILSEFTSLTSSSFSLQSILKILGSRGSLFRFLMLQCTSVKVDCFFLSSKCRYPIHGYIL